MVTTSENNLQIELNDIEHELAGPSLLEWGRYNDRDVTLRLVQLSGCASVRSRAVAEVVKRVTEQWQQTLKLGDNETVQYSVADENEVYFVREGKPLAAYLQQFSDDVRQHQMWRKIREVAVALMDLHNEDVVHGNLESSSILVCGDQAKIDCRMPVPMDTTIVFETSPEWLSPELLLSDQERESLPTKESDIFALGLCIIHAVTDTLPLVYRPDDTTIIPESISDLKQRQLLCDMCHRDPIRRPSIQEVVRRINLFCNYRYLLELTRRLQPDDKPTVAITATDITYNKSDDDICSSSFKDVIPLDFASQDRDVVEDKRIVIPGMQDLVRHACADTLSDRVNMENTVDCLSPDDSSGSKTTASTTATTIDGKRKSFDLVIDDHISVLRQSIAGLDDDILHQRFQVIEECFEQFLIAKKKFVTSLSSADTGMIDIGKLFFVHSSLYNLVGIHEDLDSLASLVQQTLNSRGDLELRYKWEIIDLVAHCDLLLDKAKAVIQDNDGPVRREVAAWCWYEFNSILNQLSPRQRDRLNEVFACARSHIDLMVDPIPDWFVPSYQVDLYEIIGKGAFGTVHRANWQGSTAAAKFIGKANEGDRTADMIREADTWFPLRHPRVSRMLGGFHFSQCFLLSEYEKHGSLSKYLKNKVAEPSDVKIAIWKLLYETALGLSYLHERGIAHGDLRGDNILVGSDGRAKIGDMGLSFKVETEGEHRVALGAWAWKGPELHEEYTGELPDGHSLMSDVYALAMCIIEAFTGCAPYSNGNQPLIDLIARYHLKHNRPPCIPQVLSDKERELVEDMCKFTPAERIKIQEVVQRLKGFAYPPHNAAATASA